MYIGFNTFFYYNMSSYNVCVGSVFNILKYVL